MPKNEGSRPRLGRWAQRPLTVVGILSAPFPLPPPVGSSERTLSGPRCIAGRSPWASWGHSRNSCSPCPPCSVPPAPLGRYLGTERRELGVTLGHWLLFSFLHRRSGFGGSHVANSTCAVAVHSCVLSCVPATPEGRKVSLSSPFVFLHAEASHLLVGREGGLWKAWRDQRTCPWEGQWLPAPAVGHWVGVLPWSQRPGVHAFPCQLRVPLRIIASR